MEVHYIHRRPEPEWFFLSFGTSHLVDIKQSANRFVADHQECELVVDLLLFPKPVTWDNAIRSGNALWQ
jgi:hypothetical protein